MATLDELQNAWDDAVAHSENRTTASPARKENFQRVEVTVPDGEHVGIIRNAGYVDKADRSFVFWEIEYPALGGKKTIYNDVAPNEMKMRILHGQIKALGLICKSPAQIPSVIMQSIGNKVSIKAQSKAGNNGKTYQNFYFKKVLDSQVPPPTAKDPDTGDTPTSDIPW